MDVFPHWLGVMFSYAGVPFLPTDARIVLCSPDNGLAPACNDRARPRSN